MNRLTMKSNLLFKARTKKGIPAEIEQRRAELFFVFDQPTEVTWLDGRREVVEAGTKLMFEFIGVEMKVTAP